MTEDAIRVIAGDCTVSVEEGDAASPREERGAVVTVVKPDDTVLVHDRDGYRPVAWLTRADAVSYAPGDGSFSLVAVRDDRRLRVTCHREHGTGLYPASSTGREVGDCPHCEGVLVHADGAVTCLDCDARYGVPRDATVVDGRCGTCGLPRMSVERGEAFDLCVDRACESLDDAVRERFDRAWSCPACEGDLRILRRGGLIAGCEGYPACEVGFSIPAGVVEGSCPSCGLPAFETDGGRRCLDATCAGVG